MKKLRLILAIIAVIVFSVLILSGWKFDNIAPIIGGCIIVYFLLEPLIEDVFVKDTNPNE